MLTHIDRCIRISPADKARLRLLFLAKHARASGQSDAVDGNHALYHHEMRSTLEAIGLHVRVADSYEALFDRPDVDFVVTLLNRGGFQNSEMLAPLLLSWRAMPHMGASPILRGVSDDKYLSKLIAQAHGVPTMAAQVFRRGGLPAQ
ncbi:MAG: phosphoribosylglycinamide synthetase, partial [Alphaproteobacteria bacterium]